MEEELEQLYRACCVVTVVDVTGDYIFINFNKINVLF